MAQDRVGSVRLSEVATAVAEMPRDDILEVAAFGSLVDWELVNFLAKAGWTLVRQSFTFKDDETLLVLKVRVEDTPYVVFVSRQSPIGCVRTLVRKMRAGSLELYPDKFA